MRYILYFAALAYLISACEEVGPLINLGDNGQPSGLLDTTYIASAIEAPQAKNVLIDEFTGVDCNNCPLGHDITKDLETLNPGRIVTVSLHSLFLGNPFSFSNQDLLKEEAENFSQLFGIPGAKPLAMIDRKIFPSETNIYHFRSKWAGFVNEQLANAATPVNVSLEKSYDATNRKLNIILTIHYTEDVTDANKFTLLLSENEIATAQRMPDLSIDTNYIHNHVFRDFLTPEGGLPIAATTEAGRTIKKEFETVLDDVWVVDNMEVVAVVHETGTSDEVYQAVKIKLKD